MRHPRALSTLLLGCVLALTLSCAGRPAAYLANETRRQEVIDTLCAEPAMRQQVVERLLGTAEERAAVIDRLVRDDDGAAQFLRTVLEDDRGKALVASQVAADPAGAKTFMRMLMLTGVTGTSLSQQQADAMGLGHAFALGNQRRTMADIKRLGERVEQWVGERRGRYPVCLDFAEARSCLSRGLPGEALEGLNLIDAWGHPFQYRTDPEGTRYLLVSYAGDKQYDGMGNAGPTESPSADIVFSNGDFIQWPGRIHRDDIR